MPLVQFRFNGKRLPGRPAGATSGLNPQGRNFQARDWTNVTVGEMTAREPGAWPWWWCSCAMGHRVLIDSQRLRKAVASGKGVKCPLCKEPSR